MAIYSLNLGFISRSDGKSSVGFSAYISGSKGFDKRTDQAFNFSHKKEVLVSRILAPKGTPDWTLDRVTLWNQVEAFEDHIAGLRFQNEESREKFINSAQTAQTVMGAIPIEFTADQAEACVEDFLKKRFVSRGLIVDYAIHGDKGNPHFHALVTRRVLEESGFSHRKDREIVSRPEHMVTRKVWEEVGNKHLKQAGLDVRIDCRSKEDQGSLFLATHHEGWHAQNLADQGQYSRLVAENEEVRQRNIEIMVEKPEALLHEISLKRTTFTQKHIEDEIIRRVGGDATLFALLKSRLEAIDVKPELILSQANDNVVYDAGEMRRLARAFATSVLESKDTVHCVGENTNREKAYTTQEYKAQEETIRACADKLNGSHRSIDSSLIHQAIINREAELEESLSKEQKDAIFHLCSGSDLRILNGRAGTGKTTLLKAVAEVYQQSGYTVWGTSFQGKAVEIMQQEISIPCRTLDSFRFYWNKQDAKQQEIDSGMLWGRSYLYAFQTVKDLEAYRFTNNHVLIVDEANMIRGNLWEPFLKEASQKGAKVIVVQDPAQIKSREAGDVGRVLSDRYGAAETTKVIRQRITWQANCTVHLNEHEVLDGLKPYYDKGHIGWVETDEEAIEKLSEMYVKTYHKEASQMALAFTNEEVTALNTTIREKLMEKGTLGQVHTLGGVDFSIGDKIRFKENDNHGQFIKTLVIPDISRTARQSLGVGGRREGYDLEPQDWEGGPRYLNFLAKSNILRKFDSGMTTTTTTTTKGIKNGTIGFIDAIQGNKITVTLEKGERVVRFNFKDYAHITHGYAMTMDKSEGSTFDRSFVKPSRFMDPSKTLVAMSRHRDDVQMVVGKDSFVDFKDLVETLSRGAFRETLQDYVVDSKDQPYLDRIKQYRDLLAEAICLREEMDGNWNPKEPLTKHPSYKGYQVCFEQKKEVAGLILQEWEKHKPFARLAGIRKDVLEVETGVRKRLLSDVEQRAYAQFKEYARAAHTARDLWERIQQTHPGVLAKSHLLYSEYKDQKYKRDGLAHEMVPSPKLYRQFFFEDSSEKKLYWASLTYQAKDYEKSHSEVTYIQSLDKASRASYRLLQSYCDTRNQAAAFYGEIKKQGEASVQITDAEKLLQFKERQLKRDEFALKVVLNMEACAPHFDRFNFKEDALLKQATNAEIRNYAREYLNQKGPFLRVEYAAILQDALKDKLHYRLAKQEGVDLDRLKFEVSFGNAIATGKAPLNSNPESLYDSIKSYLETNREAGRLWTLVRSGQEELKEKAKAANEARNDNARVIYHSQAARGVMEVFNPDMAAKLPERAEESHIRQLSQAYLTETDSVQKGEAATALSKILKEKRHFGMAKGQGVDLQRLKFDGGFGKALATGQVSNAQNPDALYEPIKQYLDATAHANALWKQVKSGQMTLKEEARVAYGERDTKAKVLIESKSAVEVLSLMNPQLREKIYTQAGVHTLTRHSREGGNLFDNGEKYRAGYVSTDQILHEASKDYERLLYSLLGKEKGRIKGGTELKFGRKNGSLGFSIAGPKAGLWYDFETGEKGNIITLVQKERGCDYKGAIDYLKGELGIIPQTNLKNITPSKPAPQTQPTKDTSMEENLVKIGAVQTLYGKSTEVQGTVVDKYLRQTRQITCDLSPDIRALPKGTQFLYWGFIKERNEEGVVSKTLNHDSLGTFARDKDGQLLSVQVTRLNNQGTRATTIKGEKIVKTKYGIGKDAFVTLQSVPHSNTVIIAEGVETALSIKQAGIDATIVAAQGIYNIMNYQGPETHIVLAADNDDNKSTSGTSQTIAKAKEHFESQGHTVTVIKPETPGHDFNDVLKEKGVDVIDTHLRPVRVIKTSTKLTALMDEIKSAKSPDQKETLEYDLKIEIKMLRDDPELLTALRQTSPQLDTKIEAVLEGGKIRGR